MKQQSAVNHVSTLKHITLIPNQAIFFFYSLMLRLSEETTQTNFIVSGLTRSCLELRAGLLRLVGPIGPCAGYVYSRDCSNKHYNTLVLQRTSLGPEPPKAGAA